MEIRDFKVLVVEDDPDFSRKFADILDDFGIFEDNIEITEFAEEAIELIDRFEPNVLLLDLRIPYNDIDDEDRFKHSSKVIQYVSKQNQILSHVHKRIQVIVISGNVEDKDLLYSVHKESVYAAIDKGDNIKDLDFIEKELKRLFNKIIKYNITPEVVNFNLIRKAEINKLNDLDPGIWNIIDSEILHQFEKLGGKKADEFSISKGIILASGQLVEIIVNLFENRNVNLKNFNPKDDLYSIRNKLTVLTGRKYIGTAERGEPNYEMTGTKKITRKSSHYAHLAYQLRNQVIHPVDNYNDKIFADSRYNKEDAAISVNLIMPLIKDYIEYESKRKK